MKTAWLFLLFLLCTLAELVCRATLFACAYLEKASSCCTAGWVKAKRRLCAEYLLTKRRKNCGRQEKEIAQTMPSPAARDGVVGPSRTVFITELPALKKRQEIKPFKSIPVEMVPVEDNVQEEAPGSYDTGTAPVEENELDELDGFGQDEESEGHTGSSSGVSFEELSDTIGVLGQGEPSDGEKQKAAVVLHHIDGTDLFNFIAINEMYAERAKALMAAFREQTGNSGQEVFDMGKYME